MGGLLGGPKGMLPPPPSQIIGGGGGGGPPLFLRLWSFNEVNVFTRALRNTDILVSVPKCPGKISFHRMIALGLDGVH